MFIEFPHAGQSLRVPRRARLGLESLESRAVMNAAPQIVNFAVTPVGDGWYMLTGHVVDEAPYGLSVELNGNSTTLQGLRADVDQSGDFSFLVELQTDGSDDGLVYATTEDWSGLFSDPVCVDVVAST